MDTLSLVTLGVAFGSLIVSILNERRTWRFTQASFRRTAERDHSSS